MFFKRSKPKEIPRTDAELIAAYKQSGDLALLGELYERYTHIVYGICMKYLQDSEDAKDAVMQIFEKLITDLQVHNVENFKSWLAVLSRNYCLMWLREAKHLPHNGFSEDFSENGVENQGFLHHNREDNDEETEIALQHLEEGIHHLPPEQKLCVELFFFENKSYKEICESTGYDLNKVKSYIQNGKRNLKIFVEKKT